MVWFFLGLISGGFLGVAFMCVFQLNRATKHISSEISSIQAEFEETVSVGVDNTTKKA